jgi:Fic family protein
MKTRRVGGIFERSSPFDAPLQMESPVNWFNDERNSLHPLLLIGVFVVHFLTIHPFQDSNERLFRIITALLLMQFGYVYIPYSSLETIIERNKENYYLALRKTQATFGKIPDYDPWLLFFLKSLQKQMIHLKQKLSAERSTLIFGLSDLLRQALEVIHDHEPVGISEIVFFYRSQ